MRPSLKGYQVWLLLLATIFLLYLPSLRGPYILDDSHTIQWNGSIQNIQNFFKLWTSAQHYSSSPDNWGYRPVVTVLNSICWWVGGGATWPFHLIKILFFSWVCLLLFTVWQVLLPKVSREIIAVSVLIFAANPIHTQVVSYISATSTLVCGAFALAALLNYLRFRETGKRIFLGLMFGAVLLSMLAKEEGIVVIALVPLVEMYLRKIEGRPLLRSFPVIPIIVPIVAAAIAMALIVKMFEPTSDIARGSLPKLHYFITQWRAYLRYMGMYFVPVGMNADNLEFGFSTSLTDPKVITAAVLNLFLVGVAVVSIKRQPVVALSILWFYIAISPGSSVVVLAEPVNDHRAFMAYLGLFGLGVWFLNLLNRYNYKIYLSFAALVLVAYSYGTTQRNQLWANNELLWRDVVAKNPSSPRAYNNLAVDLMAKARYDESLVLLDKCAAAGPYYGMCYINRAITEAALGRDDAAEADYQKSMQIDRGYIHSRLNYASFLRARGHFSKAFELLSDADKFAQGRNLRIRQILIELALQLGDHKKARELLDESRLTFGDHPTLLGLENSVK